MSLVRGVSKTADEELTIPFLFLERGYFADIKYFFPDLTLSGFKLLCGACNLKCYYCHRIPHFDYAENRPLTEIVKETDKWEPYNIATLTGGEITLFPEQAKFMIDYLHKRNKYAVFSTNATNSLAIAELIKYADVVKIDLKAARKNVKKVCGVDNYDDELESIAICASSKKPTEVKVLIHAFTTEDDIKSELADLQKVTGYPKNMILEFQLIHDFMNQGIGVERGGKYREICRNAFPLPDVVLFKEYSNMETIEILDKRNWKAFAKKDIPLVIRNEKA